MIIATWLIVILLVLILVVIISKSSKVVVGDVSIVDSETGESVKVDHASLFTHDKHTSIATQMSQDGKLVGFAAGLLELENGFNGPILFFRNDNQEGLDFNVDYISYSWHEHAVQDSLSYIGMVYDCTEPTGFTFVPASISLNQKFPNAAIDNGVFVLAWKGQNPTGMTGSTGGRGLMVFTVQPKFEFIRFDGRLIIGNGGTWRFDFKTEASGALRLGIAGWFSKKV